MYNCESGSVWSGRDHKLGYCIAKHSNNQHSDNEHNVNHDFAELYASGVNIESSGFHSHVCRQLTADIVDVFGLFKQSDIFSATFGNLYQCPNGIKQSYRSSREQYDFNFQFELKLSRHKQQHIKHQLASTWRFYELNFHAGSGLQSY